MRALLAFSLALLLLAGCDAGPTATEGRDHPNSPRKSYTATSAGDTIRAAALVLRFPDGNSLRFSNHGTFVRASATVDGVVSHVVFASDGTLAFNASSLRLDAPSLSFFAGPEVNKQFVSGDRSAGSALTNLLTTLDTYGLVNDQTTP